MNKHKIVIILFFVGLSLFFINPVLGEWENDNNISNGLSFGVNTFPYLSIYETDSRYEIICGLQSGNFHGYYWNGTSWVLDSNIVSGLPDIGLNARLTVFYENDIRKMIIGRAGGDFKSYQWSGISWTENNSIKSGIADVPDRGAPRTFYVGSTLKIIIGEYYGTYIGYYWSGSVWIEDSNIISGLDSVGTFAGISFFYDDSLLKSMCTDYNSFENSYYFDTLWINDSTIKEGIVYTNMYPIIDFFNDGEQKAIILYGNGQVEGYRLQENTTISFYPTLTNETPTHVNFSIVEIDEDTEYGLFIYRNVSNTSTYIDYVGWFYDEIGSAPIEIMDYGENCTYYAKLWGVHVGDIATCEQEYIFNDSIDPFPTPDPTPNITALPTYTPQPTPTGYPNQSLINNSLNSSWANAWFNLVENTISGLFLPIYNFWGWILHPVNLLHDILADFSNQMSIFFDEASNKIVIATGILNTIFLYIPDKIVNLIGYYLLWLCIILVFKGDT